MLKLKLQYFGHLMQRAYSPEKTLMLGKIEGTRRKGQQRMKWLDSITDSMDMNLSKIQVIKPVNPKGNQLWIFTGRTDADAEAPVLWPPDAKNWLIGKDPGAGKNRGQEEREWQGMRWLDSITNSTDMNLSKLWEIVGFPGSSAGKESTCNAGDPGLIPGSGKSTGEGIGYPLQYSWASLVAQLVKSPPAMWETWVWALG